VDRFGIGIEVDDLPALIRRWQASPELGFEEVGMVAEEELAQLRVAEQERGELLGEDVVRQAAVPGLLGELGLRLGRKRNSAEVDVGWYSTSS
jgi:hypothetical protein